MFVAVSRAEYELVCRLFDTGLSVSQGTVSRWHRTPEVPATVLRSDLESTWELAHGAAYCYLLGAYLGDGTVCHQRPATGAFGSLTMGATRYQGISAEILQAMRVTFPGATARMWASWRGESDILHIAHPAIRRAFLQRGGPRAARRPKS